MPDNRVVSLRKASAIALATASVLWLLAGFGGIVAAVMVCLAQPAWALAVSWQRDTRRAPSRLRLQQDIPGLLLAWTAAFAIAGALLAWPLAAVRDSGSLPATMALSAVIGLLLIGLWRTWPLWQELEREGGALASRWRLLAERDFHAWRGLGVAALVATQLGIGLLLAWPGLLAESNRWTLAVAGVLLSPALHWGLQRVVAARGLPVVQMPAPVASADTAAPVEEHPNLDHALFEAARGGRVERALELLDAGADAHALPAPGSRDQRSLGVLAAVLPDLRLLRALIAHGVDLNHSHAGLTPLLAATRDSWHGRPDAVTTLLANGADPRVADNEGNTPLHHAARSSDPGVAALLRDAAADIDALNHEGQSPLAIACIAGNWRLARFLLERGAKPEPAAGQPALLAAAATDEDDPAGVLLLLKHKARVATRDTRQRTALHQAAQAGNVEVVDALLAAGAEVNVADAEGRTPWLEAARAGRIAVLEKLAEANADVAAVDAEQRNAAWLACSGELVSPALLRRLLEWGVDADQADSHGKRAVDIAAAAGRWSIVSALDPTYPLPSAVTAQDEQVLPDRAPIAVVREALKAGNADASLASVLALCSARDLGNLLHAPDLALVPGHVEWLLRHGAAAETTDAVGDTPLFALLSRGAEAVPAVQVYLRHAVSPAGAGGLARFLSACAQADVGHRGLEQFALELLERGADPFAAAGVHGDPNLSLAVRLGWSRLLDRLLDIGVDREARDSHGMTALHLAAALEREPALKQLIAKGASPTARAADGQTPLGVALASGRRDLADWLDWRGWPLPRRALREADLPAAAMQGDADAVRRLLDLGFAVDAPDAQGCTALLRAAGGGHRQVVDLLIERGANPQHAAGTGATPLSAAVSMRQADIVDALLQAGADIEHRLPGGVTVLMLAAALGLPDIASRLLTAGADVHAGDAQGLSPLHCAALYGFTARDRARLLALFDTLLLSGAAPDPAGSSLAMPGSVTPLLLLLGARAEPGTACNEEVVLAGLEHLLDEDVSLESQDPRGFGPLHLAALHGLVKVVQRLLRAGADPDLRDALNRTPREIAIMRGFVDVAAEFMPMTPGAGASMARFLRDQP
ncbi:ankyrin repeat domain-containing protein [Pseudoxanthomonas dokdonensis]|uniref:Ankyrin n=1 Tax=Pseudoxanthomonas dokdonensis TaxID=344882 RepID=A0A0R0CZD2_9GAMM|nr:ankyrin repeat domain-containing protein [Pseudoxanthomonas dokdonensis]KRG71938.1 ankyrin [Pseudoxanthomonas dokdonensis]